MTAEPLPADIQESGSEKKISADKIAVWMLLGQIVGSTFLQKFAVPFGDTQLFFAMFFIVGLTAFGFLSGRLEIRPKTFSVYLAMIGIITFTQLIGGMDFSMSSLLLFMLIHVFYIFGLRQGTVLEHEQFRMFRNVISICAILGIAQYFLQFVIGADLAFFIDTQLPDAMVQKGFHEMNAMGYRSDVYKSTGFFFLEPAIFCQFLAIGLVIEAVYFRDPKRIVLLLAAIALTFSGTGLIILFLLLPIYLIQQRRFVILILGILLVGLAPLWAPMVGLGKTVNRASEFTNPHSSGYARFISIFPTLNRFVFSEADTMLFGNGAGSILRTFESRPVDYEAHNPSWGKMIFEYGMLGGLAYFMFIGYLFWHGQGSFFIKSALFLMLMILGEYILPPTVHGLILALLVWPPVMRNETSESEVQREAI